MIVGFRGAHGTDEVLYRVQDGIGEVLLNRPRAINALTIEMCHSMLRQLQEWADDEAVACVRLTGAGERGLCSGADVRTLRTFCLESPEMAIGFFDLEYRLDALIASYPKPFTAVLDGISMGGGLGLSLHASHRVGTDTTTIAMPEVTIGLFPDVGVAYELSRMPGETGTYMALTGDSIDAASARWAGLLDEGPGDPVGSDLAHDQQWIDECFGGDDAVLIVDRLLCHTDDRARRTGELIRTKSPWSVWVALRALRRAAGMTSVDEVLAQDMVLARNFVEDSDFVEGVRAQLVDKDRNPNWRHNSLADVPEEAIQQMFTPR